MNYQNELQNENERQDGDGNELYNAREKLIIRKLNELNSIQDDHQFYYVINNYDKYISVTHNNKITMNIHEVKSIVTALREDPDYHLHVDVVQCRAENDKNVTKFLFDNTGFGIKWLKSYQSQFHDIKIYV